MSGWKIDNGRVETVLGDVTGYADRFREGLSEERFADLSGCLTGGAAGGSATVNTVTGAVPGAVEELIGSLSDELAMIGNRVQAGIVGVASAAVAYMRGNEEMAGVFQSEMAAAAGSGDFSFFEENNVLDP
ncbi:MAG: hypothetical protein E7Z97_01770 [Propionibacteriaceae bacterium]|nr:hypothetical protein [Propionibacteriaceae bacterium]